MIDGPSFPWLQFFVLLTNTTASLWPGGRFDNRRKGDCGYSLLLTDSQMLPDALRSRYLNLKTSIIGMIVTGHYGS
ncbi:hypothetical protein BGZ63DRAFT_378509 [Mariannaea sp. PMI_226]|nr:hypothetical protein BGZ63DRAFT_378509 [Mariannaea sp. PMI_226]